jgi:hypothetical protein
MLYSMDSPGLCRVLPWQYCRNRQGQLVCLPRWRRKALTRVRKIGNDPGEPTLGV